MQTRPIGYEADSIDDKQQEPTMPEPGDPNREWLHYQQRVAERLEGGLPANSLRIPPRPLDEAELTALHAANPPATAEGGTPIMDYVATPPLLPTPPPAPIIAVPTMPAQEDSLLQAPDRALPWAKRLGFALFGAFLGTYIFSSGVNLSNLAYAPSRFFPSTVILAAAALGLAFLMRRTSRYAKWGAIALTMTTMLPMLMLFALQSLNEVATLLQDPYLNNPNVPANEVNWLLTDIANDTNKGFFYLAEGISMGLLAMLAVWKSLRGRWKIPGLLLILAALGTSVLLFYSEQASAGSGLSALGNMLVYLTPIVMIILYLLAAGQDRDNRR